jgi:hypothetical protein
MISSSAAMFSLELLEREAACLPTVKCVGVLVDAELTIFHPLDLGDSLRTSVVTVPGLPGFGHEPARAEHLLPSSDRPCPSACYGVGRRSRGSVADGHSYSDELVATDLVGAPAASRRRRPVRLQTR